MRQRKFHRLSHLLLLDVHATNISILRSELVAHEFKAAYRNIRLLIGAQHLVVVSVAQVKETNLNAAVGFGRQDVHQCIGMLRKNEQSLFAN